MNSINSDSGHRAIHSAALAHKARIRAHRRTLNSLDNDSQPKAACLRIRASGASCATLTSLPARHPKA
jgi:hypothetical protein